MNNKGFHYKPLSEKELQKLWKEHASIIDTFLANNKVDGSIVHVDEDIVLSIIAKVDQRRKYFEYFHQLEMSEYKEMALICFWYIKLHPISITQDVDNRNSHAYSSINEKLAVYFMFSTFRSMLKTSGLSTYILDSISKKYVRELIYSFTFRDISKEAMILLAESMAVMLGLDPYANVGT